MPWYWLLTKYEDFGLEVFVEKMPSGEVIVPIFGSVDGAAGYLSESANPWKPRKTSRGELVSLLMGVCKDTRWVALDPPPGTAMEEGIVELCASSREVFLESLLGRGRHWFEAASFGGQGLAATPRSAIEQLAHKSLPRGTGTVSTGARR